MKNILSKIRSVKLCLMACPYNEPGSEFADRISDLEEIEEEFKAEKTSIIKWISVNEKLPKLAHNVLVICEDGESFVGMYDEIIKPRTHEKIKEWGINENGGEYWSKFHTDVVLWAEFPESPLNK